MGSGDFKPEDAYKIDLFFLDAQLLLMRMETYIAVDLNFQRQNKCGSNQLGNDF